MSRSKARLPLTSRTTYRVNWKNQPVRESVSVFPRSRGRGRSRERERSRVSTSRSAEKRIPRARQAAEVLTARSCHIGARRDGCRSAARGGEVAGRRRRRRARSVGDGARSHSPDAARCWRPPDWTPVPPRSGRSARRTWGCRSSPSPPPPRAVWCHWTAGSWGPPSRRTFNATATASRVHTREVTGGLRSLRTRLSVLSTGAFRRHMIIQHKLICHVRKWALLWALPAAPARMFLGGTDARQLRRRCRTSGGVATALGLGSAHVSARRGIYEWPSMLDIVCAVMILVN